MPKLHAVWGIVLGITLTIQPKRTDAVCALIEADKSVFGC